MILVLKKKIYKAVAPDGTKGMLYDFPDIRYLDAFTLRIGNYEIGHNGNRLPGGKVHGIYLFVKETKTGGHKLPPHVISVRQHNYEEVKAGFKLKLVRVGYQKIFFADKNIKTIESK